MLVVQGRLPPEQGAVFVQALNAALDTLAAEELPAAAVADSSTEDVSAEIVDKSRDTEPFSARRADALALMAGITLEHGARTGSNADRYQVIVHVDPETLAEEGGGERCDLDDGPDLAPDTARRLACDASIVRMAEDADGDVLDVGRKTRAIPSPMRRALRNRDGGCRFPGCTARRFVDAHHVRHWADGGETRLDNLVELCRHHHRLVHEGGFGVARSADGAFEFTRPDGHAIEPAPRHPRRLATDTHALARAHHGSGLRIDADTCRCRWKGERMDLGLAVYGVFRRDGKDEYRPAGSPR